MGYATYTTENPVILDGYQAITKPGKYGFTMQTVFDQDLIDDLERDRPEALRWAESKLKNPKRKLVKNEPWEEVSEGKYKVKFSWKEDQPIPIVDAVGTPVTDPETPLYSGSKVRISFYQKPYILQDGETIGTRMVATGVQIVSLSSKAGTDSGPIEMDHAAAAAAFGKVEGFVAGEPNIAPPAETTNEDDF